MGFRTGSYMTVWSVEPSQSGNSTKVRLSSSRKKKDGTGFEQDFSGFCTFIGDANTKARTLKVKDRIKIVSCDVTSEYNREKKMEYITYKVFEFENANGDGATTNNTKAAPKKRSPLVDEGEVDEDVEDDGLPF